MDNIICALYPPRTYQTSILMSYYCCTEYVLIVYFAPPFSPVPLQPSTWTLSLLCCVVSPPLLRWLRRHNEALFIAAFAAKRRVCVDLYRM